MSVFFTRRLLALFLVLAVASLVIFSSVNLLPGDAAEIQLGVNARDDTLAAKREALGLDQPFLQRYWRWVSGFAFGEMGTSYSYDVPVSSLVASRLWVSLPLAIVALLLAVAVGLPLGIIAASRHNGPMDVGIIGVSQIGVAIPNFWFGILLAFVFAAKLRWLPAGGFPGWDKGLVDAGRAFILPSIALALPQAAILARVVRSSLLERLNEDFMRTAMAKGLTRSQAIVRHGLRNAMIPVVTILGLQFSFLIAGVIVIEEVFFLPGLGRLIFQAIAGRDTVTLQSVILLLVFAVVVVTFLVDLCYAWIDPRLRGAR